jgi:hypothetical protein
MTKPEEALEDEDEDDLMEEGYPAPDHYSAGQRFGKTPAEEARGETFAQRLRQEEPEAGDPRAEDPNRPAEEAAMHEVDDQD